MLQSTPGPHLQQLNPMSESKFKHPNVVDYLHASECILLLVLGENPSVLKWSSVNVSCLGLHVGEDCYNDRLNYELWPSHWFLKVYGSLQSSALDPVQLFEVFLLWENLGLA